MNSKAKKVTTVAMLCAIAYAVMFVCRIPITLFLKYEPKDVIITMGGFMFGPLTSLLVSVVVSAVEMFTTSETGWIGLIMNILSSCSFSCIAALIYKRRHTVSGAVIGLISGCLLMTAVMLLWNYLVTPLYMGCSREDVAELLIPAFLPFNLLKGGMNTAITLFLYKPVVTALRKAHLIERSSDTEKSGLKIGLLIVAAALLITCILLALMLAGVL